MVPKKDPNNYLEQKLEEFMQISTKINQNITNLQQTISNTNDELRKTNENLTQLWITLDKAKENERKFNQLEETKDQMILDMKMQLVNNLKESIEQSIKIQL